MKASVIIQVVIILLLLASAASCEVGKEYTSRLFKTGSDNKENTHSIKFLQSDSSVATVSPANTVFTNEAVKDTVKNNAPVVEENIPAKAPAPGTVRTKKVRE